MANYHVPQAQIRVAFIAAMLALLTGCGMTPARKIYMAADTLDATNRAVLVAAHAGKITDQQLVAYDEVKDTAQKAIESAREDVDNPFAFEWAWDSVVDALSAVLAVRQALDAEAAKPPRRIEDPPHSRSAFPEDAPSAP